MLALGIVLSIVGLCFFCRLLFTLAIYALPTFAGLTAGLASFHSEAGVPGAITVGLLVGGATLAFGQLAFAGARTPLIRAICGLLYGVPAAIAGYQVSFALAGIGMVGNVWQTAFAAVGAVVSGCTAFSRLALLTPSADAQGTRSASSLADRRLHDQGR
ncbi:hypothetical protein LJ725_16860 [Reyranella aquatilis]|uniref:Major facilitator superfamily (MFS) profile domain-containing protein n=1 Tax=Reyranella aquatilis TaxID=2035356 RepID=A0ABS8KX13_9HYPH|nr:hypothetical protein [Reyranella aquatilis]MCC8430644.1 hypothetical protein [Reyranella aquatilis]